MANKMTKKDFFNRLLEVLDGADLEDKTELQEFVAHEKELLEKKASSKKPTAKQKENEELVEVIYTALKNAGKALTITDLQNLSPALSTLENQRISALLKKLVDGERVVKTYEKKKAYFAVVAE